MHAFPFDLDLFLDERNHEPTPDVNFSAAKSKPKLLAVEDSRRIKVVSSNHLQTTFNLVYGECVWVKRMGSAFWPEMSDKS